MICLTATLVLAVTYQITKPKIDEQLKKEEFEALKVIEPEADSFEEKIIEGTEYYEAIDNGKTIGYCIRATGHGYAGFIRMLVGIDKEGVIRGVEILEHQETPGLGARIVEIKPGEKTPWFLRQYIGKPAKDIEVRKNIDAITGATITSRAVTDAVRKAVDEFLSKVKK
jgi:electron transport complex protein RnfG